MSATVLPRRNLESLKKEAKRWLDALQANDSEARARFDRALPQHQGTPTLRDVQLALARDLGFDGWTALRDAVELEEFEIKARALLEAYRTGTPDAMEAHWRLTWHRRAWQAMRFYVQLDLGKRPANPGDDVAITLDDARYLVAREHRFANWEALVDSVRRGEKPKRPKREIDSTRFDAPNNRPFGDDDLRALAEMSQLEHLNLAGTAVTDAGVAELVKHLPRLRSLNLMFTRTGNETLCALAGRESLRHLWTGVGVTDDGIRHLHDIPVYKTWLGGEIEMGLVSYDSSPNQLTLRGSFTDRGMNQLRGLDGLFGLNVDDAAINITADAMVPLIDLQNLGWLAADAKDDWMPHIAAMPKLRFLGVQDTSAGDDGFQALSRSQTIEHIWGRRCHNLRTRGFKALAKMPALRGLSVSCLNVEDEGIALLPSFPSLRVLMPMDIPDAGYRHIGQCEALDSLILMYCRDTTDAATEHITSLRKLTYYFNSYTTITDRTPELLSTMDSLERIELDRCHWITNEGVAKLARLPNLVRITVSGRQLTPDVVRAFGPDVETKFFF
jgi:hypothetical protein